MSGREAPGRMFVSGLRCLSCGEAVSYGDVMTCPACGPEGILDVEYEYGAAAEQMDDRARGARALNHWRYLPLLPVLPGMEPPRLHVGWTPVVEAPRLAREIGAGKLLIKDDSRNPTSSFKDRASSVGVMKAMEFGYGTIACASTGNAASSLAGLAASAGLSCTIFVPERAPEPKVTQLLIFGARVLKVRGSYEQAFELCRLACAEFGWYNRNSGTNPFLVEGKKTAGLEIAEQLQHELPDWVAVSVGDGCTIGGIGKGLQEMKRIGIISRVPRLLGVQAEGAQPVVTAFRSGKGLVPVSADTLADSIAVGTPRNWRRAVAQVRSSGGEMIAVSDGEILDAMRLTARLAGIFAEPAGAASVAGVRKAVTAGIISPAERVLALITGNGLKDIQSARRAAGREQTVDPDIESVRRALAPPAGAP